VDPEQRGVKESAVSAAVRGFRGEMTMEATEVVCKTALSASTLPGLVYSLNPYRGCQHNCAYCYGPNVLRMERGHWGDHIEVKTNIPVVLAKELRTKKPGVVGISTVTDPYQPLEWSYHLTRQCLEQLVLRDFPAHVQTKSTLVTRDIDLLRRFSDSQVMMSVGTLDDQERRLLEPGTSPISERLAALRKISDAGIRTAVFFGPVYPSITKEEIPRILDVFSESGAEEVWIDQLNLKPGIWENIQRKLYNIPEKHQIFEKNVFQNRLYYQDIKKEIHQRGQERHLRIIDAF
jgi:DNA repair photolyase